MSPPPATASVTPSPSRASVVTAFTVLYVVWGSTYLAMRMAVQTLPPFLLASVRFFTAGLILALWSRRSLPRLSRAHVREAAISGGLLLVVGNGGVVWAVQFIPSGLTALMVATVPLWMVLIDWATGGQRPRALVALGLLAGLAGVALLLGPAAFAGAHGASLGDPGSIPPLAAGVLVMAAVSWSVGSLRARRAPRLPEAPLLLTGLQMLFGGLGLGILALATRELGALHPDRISLASVLAVAYLIVFGSLLGYTAFIWLLERVSSARVSTYAYVNPVIAVFLGWAIGHEPLSGRLLLGAAIILGAVAIITWGSARVPAVVIPKRA